MRALKNGLLLPLGILLLWYLVTALHLFSPYLLPSPGTTLQSLGELCASGALPHHLAISLERVFSGFLLSCLAAIPLGILCGRSRSFESYCWPLLEFLRHVPPLACIPLIILWTGIGEASKLTIIFLASFSPLFLNTYSGIKNCDPKLLEVGRSLNFSESAQIRHIQLPGLNSKGNRRQDGDPGSLFPGDASCLGPQSVQLHGVCAIRQVPVVCFRGPPGQHCDFVAGRFDVLPVGLCNDPRSRSCCAHAPDFSDSGTALQDIAAPASIVDW